MEITDRELLAICNLSNFKDGICRYSKRNSKILPDPDNEGEYIKEILQIIQFIHSWKKK